MSEFCVVMMYIQPEIYHLLDICGGIILHDHNLVVRQTECIFSYTERTFSEESVWKTTSCFFVRYLLLHCQQ